MADQKDVRHLPSPLRVGFGHSESKNTILNRFWVKNAFFTLFSKDDSEGPPGLRNFCQQQIGQNRPIWGARPKIGNIWPPKTSTPKSCLWPYFQLKIRSQTRFWGRGFGGSNVADFWARTSYRPILPDLLLAEISETWGPLWVILGKERKKRILHPKSVQNRIFRFWMTKTDP